MVNINNLKILSDLSSEEKEQLSFFCQEKVLKEGETLFYEGDEASALYILMTGEIEISHKINEKSVVLGKVYPEEILGEMALFGKKSYRMATATALKDSQLFIILSFSIKELTEKQPKLFRKIQLIIEERTVNNKITELEIEGEIKK